MLYKLAQEGFKPAKYFSIDRVFRNEAIDRTHLAEFHQIEGGFPKRDDVLRTLSFLLVGVNIAQAHVRRQRLSLVKLSNLPDHTSVLSCLSIARPWVQMLQPCSHLV
jgi:aspartyl-tRNA synthetase